MQVMQEMQEMRVQSLDWEDPRKRKWQHTPVFLPGESHGCESLEGCSPWGHKRVRQDLVTKQIMTIKKALALLCCLSIKENFLILLIETCGHAL